ncbi:LacI family DNA-binding transcriptional regulator [Ralstonia solanacearum]|uniref:LacI family DNA-binding transcriptional regulator n=1 Tax=Ralstonia solanacearum TaxID=305 RepID=UPI0018D08625|nr:LacI family DNA-binding transcriptional regulator [Ralstonia solanacearum]
MLEASARRPTLGTVAKAAGVSVATVDRVFNSRLPVRDATAARVLAAAKALGWHGAELMRRRIAASQRSHTLAFCLQKSEPFYQAMARCLQEAAQAETRAHCTVLIDYVGDIAPQAVAQRLMDAGRRADAVGVVAMDHPHVNAAVAELSRRPCPVFALLTEIGAPECAGYVGLDSRKVGRTAGWAMARLARPARAPGKVGVLVGSQRYACQEAWEMGFRAYLRACPEPFDVLEAQLSLDDDAVAYEATVTLLARHPDLAGLYVAGGGSAGVIRALRETSSPRRPVVLCHDARDATVAALIDGVIDLSISTPLPLLARTVVGSMLDALEAGGTHAPTRRHPLPFQLLTPENV